MFNSELVLLPVSVDNWNSSRTEYYTTYETEFDKTLLLTILTDAAAMLNQSEHWSWYMAAGILTTVFEHHADWVARPFGTDDVHDFVERVIDVNNELYRNEITAEEWLPVIGEVMSIWIDEMFEDFD